MTDDSLNDTQQAGRTQGSGGSASNVTPTEPILQFFEFNHLSPYLQVTSSKFCDLAHYIVSVLPRNSERTVALRKLLEAKDAAVRARLFK